MKMSFWRHALMQQKVMANFSFKPKGIDCKYKASSLLYSKTSSSIFPLSRKLEPIGRNSITYFIPGGDGSVHLPTSRVSSVSRFSKKQSKFRQIESQKTATQVCWSVLDLPSEPEMGGKRMMEWFLSPHKALWR